MVVAQWENPPPSRSGCGVINGGPFIYQDEADELAANPGRWGVLSDPDFPWMNQTQASNVAYGINRGKYAAFRPAGAYRACSRIVRGEVKLFVQYIGEARDAGRG